MAKSHPEIVSYAAFLEYRAARLRAPVIEGTVIPPEPEVPAVPDTRTLVVPPTLAVPDSRG